jgi:hypothetical protein
MITQVRRWVLVMGAAVALSFTGCKKDKGGGGGAGGAGAAAAHGALQMMPKDADLVMGINFGSLKSSALFKKYEPMMKQAMGSKLEEFKGKCGFDPLEKFGTLTMAMKGTKDDAAVTGVISGFDRAQVTDCLKKFAADKSDGEAKEVKVDGDTVTLTGGKEPMTFRFVGDSILFAKQKGSDQPVGKDGLETIAKQGEGDSILGSPAFMEVYKKINTDDSLWFVLRGDAAITADAPVKFKAAWGSVAVTDGLALDASVRMNSADEAKQAAEMGNSQLGQVKGMFLKEASLSADGADVRLKASMTGEQIESLAGMMKGMMGGGMGGGGMGGGMGTP